MSASAEISFNRLLVEWNRHEQLRHTGADIAQLGASRARLEDRRREFHDAA